MLTPRENLIAFFKGQDYAWLPSRLDMLPFMPELICDNVARGLVVQQRPYTGPLGGKDLLGVDWFFEESVGGSMEKAPLFNDIEDWENYVHFPDLDALDWEGCARDNAEYLNTDKLVHTILYTGFFERLISFVGFENAAVAMIDEEQQDCVKAIFEKLTEFYIDLIGRMKRYFQVEMVVFHDDWGTQNSTLMSPETHREMVLPYVRRLVQAAHEMGVFMEQHSCGKLDTLVPNIIQSGVDTWNGQDICDKPALVARYGDRFCFGISVHAEEGPEDGELRARVEAALDQWKGSRICLAVWGPLTPAQREMVRGLIRGRGRNGAL